MSLRLSIAFYLVNEIVLALLGLGLRFSLEEISISVLKIVTYGSLAVV